MKLLLTAILAIAILPFASFATSSSDEMHKDPKNHSEHDHDKKGSHHHHGKKGSHSHHEEEATK